jgi:tol-pal system protein YbgF
MRPETLFLSALLTLGLVGSAASATAGQKKEDVILAELRQIQAQLAQLQTSQAALKSAVEALTSEAASQQDSFRKTFADSKLTIERMQQDMSILTERVDETNTRLADIRQEVTSLRQSPVMMAGAETMTTGEPGAETPEDEAGTSEESEEPMMEPPVVAAAPNVTDIYNQARIDYTQGRYPLAISGFKEVLDLDARGDLADNAHYWMGECYLAQRQNDLALAEFDRIIRDYPESNKRPDAYLKKAMTLEEMGRRSEANLMYELVIEQFPRTTQERVARRKLEELMKTTVPKRQP